MGETTKFCRVAVSDLIPYINNAKIHTEDQITRIASSIREFGFLNPVLIDAQKNIIAGHGRIMAAKKLGMAEVPCVYVEGLTDAQRKAYILADNRLAEMADWDMDLVRGELEELQELGFDTELTGFELELEEDPEVVEDEIPEEVESRAKEGDMWELGEHRVICGDSTDPEVIDKLMGGAEADLLLTDPPYNVNYSNKAGKIANDNLEDSAFRSFLRDAFHVASSKLRGGGAFYIWHADTEGLNFRGAAEETGLHVRQCIIWNKNGLILGRSDYQWKHEPCLYGWKDGGKHYFTDDRKQATVIEDPKPDFKKMKKEELRNLLEQLYSDRVSTTVIDEKKPLANDMHPTMKPLGLLARQIRNSTKQGWLVLDTFGGSGSTLMACEQLNRKCYTCELDPHYVDVILQRWEDFTGKKAVLANG